VPLGSIAVTAVIGGSIRAIVAVSPMAVHPEMAAMPPVTTARAEVGRLLRYVGGFAFTVSIFSQDGAHVSKACSFV
jgi:hypothetical protein